MNTTTEREEIQKGLAFYKLGDNGLGNGKQYAEDYILDWHQKDKEAALREVFSKIKKSNCQRHWADDFDSPCTCDVYTISKDDYDTLNQMIGGKK